MPHGRDALAHAAICLGLHDFAHAAHPQMLLAAQQMGGVGKLQGRLVASHVRFATFMHASV